MAGSKRRQPPRQARRTLSLSSLFCLAPPRTVDSGIHHAEIQAPEAVPVSKPGVMRAAATAARPLPPPPSVALESYLGREKLARDAVLADATICRPSKDAESLHESSSCCGPPAPSGANFGEECDMGPAAGAWTSSDTASLSGPYTPDGRPAQAKPSIASSPEFTASSSSVDEGAPGASAHARSLSIPTPPDSPAWGEQREFSLGRKLTVLRSHPAVVVLADDPDSPQSADGEGGGIVQRRLSQVVAGHHVHFTKIKRQMGNVHAPPEDLLTLMARKVFTRQNCSFNQMTSMGELSDLAAETSMPTPSSRCVGAPPTNAALAAAAQQLASHATVHTTSLSCMHPSLPPIRTRLAERRHTSPLA